QIDALRVAPVIAVREEERIDVPLTRIVSLVDDVHCELVRFAHLCAAGVSQTEEVVFGHPLGFGVTRDEDDLRAGILLTKEPQHPEVERPAYVGLELAHGAGDI